MNARLIAAAGAILLIAVAAVTIRQTVIGPPFGGVSRDRAIAVARSFEPGVGNVLQATAGRCDELEPNGHIAACTHAHWVWAVDFSGTWYPSGGGAPMPGQAARAPLPPHHSMRVFVDYMTGTAIFAGTPSPGYGN